MATESGPSREGRRELLDDASRSIEEIQISGRLDRARIHEIKQTITTQIEETSRLEQLADAEKSANRAALLQALGKAAQAGDLEEMRRIKQLLDQPKP